MNFHLQYVSAQQHLHGLRRDAERVRVARQLRRSQRHAGVKAVITWIGALVPRPGAAPAKRSAGEAIRPASPTRRPASSEFGSC